MANIKSERIWDNSNIAESYTGITLPLTASFAREMYEVVYSRVLRTSGMAERQVFAQRRVLRNLLGFPAGRFYYNLNNWYVLLSFFPMFRGNKKFLEQMIGVPEDESVRPPKPSIFFIGWYIPRTLLRVAFFSRELTRFYTAFDRYYANYKSTKGGQLSIIELEELYDYLLLELLYRWHTPIDNDFLVMIFHGWLRKLSTRYGLLKSHPALVNDLLTGLGGVVSSDQANRLVKISRVVQQNDQLQGLFASRRWDELQRRESEWPDFVKVVKQYQNKFGDRFANEMKLETRDISEDPAALYRLIDLYTRVSDQELKRREKNRQAVRQQAEKHLTKSLSGGRRLIYRWVLKRARWHIKHREKLRLLRTQTFGAARYIFLGMAKHLVKQGVLRDRDDIYYLEVSEIWQAVDGSATVSNLQALADLRRGEYREHKNQSLPTRFTTSGIPHINLPGQGEIKHKDLSIDQGVGCSSGIVTGTAYVMVDFEPNADMPADAILVTRHTDPGWMPIFSYVQGLVVEHGGLLSHAAIVSRELGIPCVVGVPGATRHIKTGDKIKLDGAGGRVVVTRQ